MNEHEVLNNRNLGVLVFSSQTHTNDNESPSEVRQPGRECPCGSEVDKARDPRTLKRSVVLESIYGMSFPVGLVPNTKY